RGSGRGPESTRRAARTRSSCSPPRSPSGSCSRRWSTGGVTPTPATEPRGLGAAARNVAEHASAIARLELELALLELKRKVASLGIGIALGLGALLMLLFALGFGLAAAAAGIATVVPTWAALLIVTGALVGL